MSSTVARAAGLIVTCIVAGGLVLAAPADAAGHPNGTRGLHATLGAQAAHGVSPDAASTTDLGAGYFTYPSEVNGLASVSATFTMPAITCVNPHDAEWLLPGIWVYSSGSLTEQVDVNFNCNSGVQYQMAVICLTDGCATEIAVAPGDKVVTSLAYTPTATIGTVKDVTAGTKTQFVGAANTTDQVVFVGDTGPDQFIGGTIHKVPQFSKVQFTSVQVNGEYLVDSPAPRQYNLKTGAVVQISTTAILSDGASFTTNFKHS